jgi:hypothetical protein
MRSLVILNLINLGKTLSLKALCNIALRKYQYI